MQWTVVVFLFWHTSFTFSEPISSPIGLQTTEPGIRHLPSDPRPKVKLEIFVDLNCPDSNAAWPVLKQVQDHYGNDQLDLVLQQLPLPYHRNALLCTQGVYVIEEWTPEFVFNYVEAVLASWNQFSTSKTVNKTETKVINELADIAVQATGIEKKIFISELGSHRRYVIAAWKYAVKRGVASTPTYFVNGVDLAVGNNYAPTFDEWVEFLDPIINSS